MEENVDILRQKIPSLKNSKEKVDTLNELSWLIRYEQNDEGVKLAREAMKLSKKLGYASGEAYGKLNLAANQYLEELNEEVIRILLESLDYFKEKEEGFSKAHNFLAMVHESYGDYETAMSHAESAVSYAALMGYKEGEGDALSTLGLVHNRLCDFVLSLSVFKRSLKLRMELGNDKAVASSLNLIARTYSLSGDYDLARDHYEQSLVLREKIKDTGGLPWTYIGIASLLEKQEKYTEAISQYEKCIELNEMQKELRMEFLCMLGMGKAYLNLKDIQNADHYLHKACDTAKEINSKPLLMDVYYALGQYYEEIGNLEKALSHLKRFHEIEREVNNQESRSRLKNQQIVNATAQSRKEAEIFQLRNVELKSAYDEIEEKNHEITASIIYAERIQRAVLPPDDYIKEILPEHFILFLPRDIVSGDYYWATEKDGQLVFTAADCTGHGIPGAFMSMLGVSYLNEIVNRMPELKANEILNELRKHIMESLHQEGKEGEAKDGMDMGLCVYDKTTRKLQFSGAYNSMYIIRKGELDEVKADRMPISIHHHSKEAFTNHVLKVGKGDVIYLLSDGYPDQFGGPEGKKFKNKNMKELLLKVHQEPMEKQRSMVLKRLEEWKGDLEQVDDVILMGIRF